MATTEGTLVASYNRGMKVLNLSRRRHLHGGRRLPCSARRCSSSTIRARGARFRRLGAGQLSQRSREEAEATRASPSCSTSTPTWPAKFAYLRFNYTTGDAAGQNMVGRATFAACSWILEQFDTDPPLLSRVELRHRQEGVAGQHHAHARQARDRRGRRSPRRARSSTMRVEPESLHLPFTGRQRRRVPLGRQQQRRAFAQRHHGDVHRHRPGRGQRRPSRRRASSTPS